MTNDDLDRILTGKEIVPSSGFTSSVMDAVRREASVPAPIPFPWKRAIPGIVAAAVTIVALLIGIAGVVRNVAAAPGPGDVSALQQMVTSAVGQVGHFNAGQVFWTAIALVMSAASLVLPFRIARR